MHPQTPTSPLAGKSIVTVEDEGVTQLQLRKLLSRAGLKVVGQARNGKEGVEIILRERPDLVTMDITMPVMDGIEATRRVLEQYTTCVVILTAYVDEDYEAKARQSGAHGFLVKPIVAETLIPALEHIYEEHCPKAGQQ